MKRCKSWLMLCLLALFSTAAYASARTVRATTSNESHLPTLTITEHPMQPSWVTAKTSTEPLILLAQNRIACGPDPDASCPCNYGADSVDCNCLSNERLPDGSCSSGGSGIFRPPATPAITSAQGGSSSNTLVASPSSRSTGNSPSRSAGTSQLPFFEIFVGIARAILSVH